MRVCGIESTPNPSSFKFDLDQSLGHRSGAAGATKGFTYSSVGAAGDQQAPEPILRVLELQGVESVYALGDWLCVNKKPSAKWDAIVPAAVEALGGPAESLDPLTLLMASGGDGGSAWQRSEMDGIAIRLQVSNGIPIQVEACPPGGTLLRRKLSSRFVDAMTEFVSGSGDEMAFFKGRQWIPRGEALSAAAEEVELAYHESRLRGAVDAALNPLLQRGGFSDRFLFGLAGCCGGSGLSFPRAMMMFASTPPRAPLDSVAGAYGGGSQGPIGEPCSPCRPQRAASFAMIDHTTRSDTKTSPNLTPPSTGTAVLARVCLVDLGNPAAVPIATAGLCDKSKLVRWRAARVVGELASREQDAVSLDEAREGEGEFEVAFEMSDAARKVRARVAAAAEGGEEGVAVAGVGPVWKQIQERGL
ncbi:unnamed protein product [Scytosiphon promiscuus]